MKTSRSGRRVAAGCGRPAGAATSHVRCGGAALSEEADVRARALAAGGACGVAHARFSQRARGEGGDQRDRAPHWHTRCAGGLGEKVGPSHWPENCSRWTSTTNLYVLAVKPCFIARLGSVVEAGSNPVVSPMTTSTTCTPLLPIPAAAASNANVRSGLIVCVTLSKLGAIWSENAIRVEGMFAVS